MLRGYDEVEDPLIRAIPTLVSFHLSEGKSVRMP